MSLQKVSLLDVSITISPKSEILAFVQSFFSKPTRLRQACLPARQGFGGQATIIVTPNPEQIMLAQRDEEFRMILNSAEVALPDGSGVVWAINKQRNVIARSPEPAEGRRGNLYNRLLRFARNDTNKDSVGIAMTKPISRISGVDFMEELCVLAVKNSWKVVLIGGRNGVAQEALSVLQKKYPGLEGWAEEGPEIKMQNGKLKIENRECISLVRRIAESGTKIVFVGLGAPKQEFFIDLLRKKSVVLMSVGGAFDMISGKIKRAPVFIRQLGLEWLWRLIQEPWRIKRQVQLVEFVYRVLAKNCPKLHL